MGTKAIVTAVTTLGAAGVKTLMEKLQLPQAAKRIIGVWSYAIAKDTLTSTEAVTGIVELESTNCPGVQPCQLPLAVVSSLTGGHVGYEPRIIPVDIPVSGMGDISCYITEDDTHTGAALAGRVGLIIEV